jgi:SepF-like predicted cell division protein (DUF552 family)
MNTNFIRRCWLPVAVLLLGMIFTGCDDSQDTPADQAEAVQEAPTEAVKEVVTELTAGEEILVTQVAAIATELEKAPATAEAVLERYGMTAEEYEAAVYKIASNPKLSAAFEIAMNP